MIPDAAAPAVATHAVRGAGIAGTIGRTAAPRLIADRSNGITPLRLGLAMLVVFSHAYPAGGFGHDDLYRLTGVEFGTAAVLAFFGLSGYLLAKSRLSSSLARYVQRRALRILPGLWVCLAVTLAIVIPLAAAMGGHAASGSAVAFVAGALTFQPFPVAMPGLYPGSGEPGLVNVPLWTLPWEVYLYGFLALVGIGGRATLRLVLPAALLLALMIDRTVDGSALESYGHLPVAFLVGSCAYVFAIRLAPAAAIAIVVSLVAAIVAALELVAPVTLPVVAIWVGFRLPLRWSLDLSYGVYIYGWLVEQLLAEAGVARLGVLAYFVAALVPVLAIAYVSARFVETPFLRLSTRRLAIA